MQKEAKSLSSIRSLSIRPTISPRASKASRQREAANSVWAGGARCSRATFKAAAARRRASAWRTPTTRSSAPGATSRSTKIWPSWSRRASASRPSSRQVGIFVSSGCQEACAGCAGRSDLLAMTRVRVGSSNASSSAGNVGGGADRSTTSRRKWAARACSSERSMPACSKAEPPTRRPAVSTAVTARGSPAMGASRKSRVVPGSALTSARAEPLSALSKLDFPAFGAPTTATRRPSRSAAAWRAVRAYPESSDSILANVCKGPLGSSVGRSSSGKSMCASSVASAARRRSLHVATCRPSSPASWRRAEASARSELA